MSEADDNPMWGLLADIADGVAALAARMDAMEASKSAHHTQMNDALATIAEIATRTYYSCNPSSALPDGIINTAVMNAMIDTWPRGAVIRMSSHDRRLLSELDQLPDEYIEKLINWARANEDASNASRIRIGAIVDLLNKEKKQRAEARSSERDPPGRSR